MPPVLLAQLLDALRSVFGIAPDAEVSMEADPGQNATQQCCITHVVLNGKCMR